MSDIVPTITKVEKEKDPRRVASGKRLALVSAAAKERKRMERAEASEVKSSESSSVSPSSVGYSSSTLIAGVGLLMGVACLYLAYRQDVRAQLTQGIHPKSDSSDEAVAVAPNSTEQRRIGKQYSLDD